MASAGKILLMPKGEYDSGTAYSVLDWVRYGGKAWVCKQNSAGNAPAENTYWTELCADGIDGENGESYYMYIRYSENSDGTGFVDTPTESTVYIGFYTGNSNTAPTDKALYTWSKYVGSGGGGTGAWGGITGKPFSSVGSDGLKVTSGVLDVDTTKVPLITGNIATANRLSRINVTGADVGNTNKWTKVGSFTAGGTYRGYSAILSITDGVFATNTFFISINFRTGAAANIVEEASLGFNSFGNNKAHYISKDMAPSFKLVYTAPLFELWFNPLYAYLTPVITVINETSASPNLMTYYSNQPYQDTAPTGTVLACTPLPVTSGQLPTASSSAKGAVKVSGTDGLTMDGETLKAAVKGLITSENDFNAQTASTSKAVDSNVMKEILDDMNGIALTGTLTASATSITITDAAIVTGNTVKYDYYTDVYDVSPTAVSLSTGSMTLTFDAQTVDVAVRVEIREV